MKKLEKGLSNRRESIIQTLLADDIELRRFREGYSDKLVRTVLSTRRESASKKKSMNRVVDKLEMTDPQIYCSSVN